jgi:prevent-host-death family protein
MSRTQVRPSRDLRNNYADIVKSLNQNDHIIITNNGVGESVLIGFKDYEKYKEFLHHRYVYEELQKSKTKVNDPNIELHGVADVFARMERKIAGRGL